jgi:hypothetical protein
MAVIQSKVTRSFYKNAALAFIPDLLVAWAVMKYMGGSAEAFFFTLIALQAGTSLHGSSGASGAGSCSG